MVKVTELYGFRIESIASDLNRKALLDYMLGRPFFLYHDMPRRTTSIITYYRELAEINRSSIGIKVTESHEMPNICTETLCITTASFLPKAEQRISYPIDNLYRVFSGTDYGILTLFYPSTPAEITRLKGGIEEKLSRMEVRQSYSTNSKETRNATAAFTDSYYQSYEKKLLSMLLENINDIMVSRFSAYKVAFLVQKGAGADEVLAYLKSNMVVLSHRSIKASNINELYSKSKTIESMPLSYANASQSIGFSNRISLSTRISTSPNQAPGDIPIGKYIDSAVNETEEAVSIHAKTLNLGTLITGLPGTGKTKLAKNIIEKSLEVGCKVAVISPTSEWNHFGRKNGLKVLRVADPDLRISFFRCETKNARVFYENLAMLIAVGCNAGPYTNSMEKCLFAAFSKVYANSDDPDPQLVYSEIEESIIEQHAKRSNNAVKYTKHGENTRSSLEGLRQLLMMPQFAYQGGISFAHLLEKGLVIDLSGVSNNTKALLYALLLNKIYSICDGFDLNGDDKLRLMLCLEEAQLVFNAQDESSATIDLKERIQNFRKNGIGLMLITHNINDINPSIRRLCQNKFYFRQSSDVAKYAANDLIFNETDNEKAVTVLKALGQRECAINQVVINNGQKSVSRSIFSKVYEYKEPEVQDEQSAYQDSIGRTVITIKSQSPEVAIRRCEIFYLGERIMSKNLGVDETIEHNLLPGKVYKLVILGDKKRDSKEFYIKAGTQNIIDL